MKHEPSPKRLRGAPVEELLEMENKRVLTVLEPALDNLLSLAPATAEELNLVDPVRTTTPVLTLHLLKLSETKLAQALSAFSVLIEHSRRLREYPDAKYAFWINVMQSQMPRWTLHGVPDASLREPTFPLFALDCLDDGRRVCAENLPPQVLPEDAVVDFFTTPPVMPTPTRARFQPRPDVNGPDAVAIELKFAYCGFTSQDAIEAVERLLARVFTHPRRQFAVSALDLSRNPMAPSELAVVARIAHKCRYEYQVSGLWLRGIMPWGILTYLSKTTPPEFLDIMRAAYGVRAPVLSSAGVKSGTKMVKDVPIRASTLRNVSLTFNHVRLAYFEALFSALRYGSPVHKDFSEYVANDQNGVEEEALCASWQAFGLFYPRPKRFRKLLRLRNIGALNCSKKVVEAFTKTLHNPATQLVYGGVDPTGTNAAAAELLVCTVEKGASVDLLTIDPNRPSQLNTREIEAECVLEGLCERDEDGAVCIVIPGVGLGWVQRGNIRYIEREPLESAWEEQDGRYAVQLAGDFYEIETVVALVALVGRQIYSLSFEAPSSFAQLSIVPQIIQPCANLRHLSLQGLRISNSNADALLDALRTGPLRTQLLSLNLNGSKLLGNDTFLQQLATILGAESNNSIGSEDRLALEELRIYKYEPTKNLVAMLFDALRTNRRLRLLQLTRADREYNTDVYAKQNEMKEVYDGQLLWRTLPTEAKLAFLSVTNLKTPSALDTNLLTHIFQFANSGDIRRVIAFSHRR